MYKLRAELRAHEADVKSIASSPSGELLATASRDKTIIIWSIGSSTPVKILRGHTHFVSDVLFINESTLASSSNDKTIRIWDVSSTNDSDQPTRVLEGHSSSVCALSKVTHNCIMSCSWDNTARVWNVQTAVCVYQFSGHSAAVWNGCYLGDSKFMTVSADQSIREWIVGADFEASSKMITLSNGRDITQNAKVHTDVIRDVTKVHSNFATVANDSKLVLWKPGSGPLAVSSDLHNGDYIYSVLSLNGPDGGDNWIVSAGEDNAVRLTKVIGSDLQPDQVIMHPSTVWKATSTPDGKNILTACSDGVARIFSNDPAHQASAEELKEYSERIAQRKVDTRLMNGVDISKVPAKEHALSTPGVKDGDTRIVKADGKAEVYMWSNANYKWSKVGDVVDGPNSNNQDGVTGIINGKEYDFTFDVELDQSGTGPKRKLGYNKGENPYLAAQRFIDEHHLDQDFLAEIADFIEKNVPKHLIENGGSQMASSDPLTGGSRYVPGSSGASAGGSSDPLTGGSRYVPGSSSASGNGDTGSLPPARKLIPYRDGMITYKSSDQLDKIQQKLSDSNTALAKDESTAHLALNMEEAATFGQSLMPKLKANCRNGSALIVTDEECQIIDKFMEWPVDNSGLFAAIDVARLIICSASGSAYFFGKQNGKIVTKIIQLLSDPSSKPNLLIMLCRFVCNMFSNRVVLEITKANLQAILQAGLINVAKSQNKRARETFASIVVNAAVVFYEAPKEDTSVSADEIINVVVGVVQNGEREEDVVYRLLVALGSVMCKNNDVAKKALELGAAQVAADCAPLSPRLQQVALEIATLIAK